MMKKITVKCFGFWLCFVVCVSGAVDQYVEVKSGLCIPQRRCSVHYKNAPCFSAEWGLRWEAWRLGLQMGYVKYEIKRTDGGEDGAMWSTIFNPENGYFENLRFSTFSVMANVYRDWQVCDETTLYVGCGLGMARLNYRFTDKQDIFEKGEGFVFNQDKYLFAAQLMCGISHELNDHWSVSLGYRCMKTENVKYNVLVENAEEVFRSLRTPFLHSLEVGLRYSF